MTEHDAREGHDVHASPDAAGPVSALSTCSANNQRDSPVVLDVRGGPRSTRRWPLQAASTPRGVGRGTRYLCGRSTGRVFQ